MRLCQQQHWLHTRRHEQYPDGIKAHKQLSETAPTTAAPAHPARPARRPRWRRRWWKSWRHLQVAQAKVCWLMPFPGSCRHSGDIRLARRTPADEKCNTPAVHGRQARESPPDKRMGWLQTPSMVGEVLIL